MFALSPFKSVPWLSIIAERRWDKYALSENSIGLRIKLWSLPQ